jgi:hypothetical protein
MSAAVYCSARPVADADQRLRLNPLLEVLSMPSSIEIIATLLFAVAVLHTFSVPVFARLAHRGGPHAGFWHLFSEVDAVFGVWAFVLIVAMAALAGPSRAIDYMDTRNYTEPL